MRIFGVFCRLFSMVCQPAEEPDEWQHPPTCLVLCFGYCCFCGRPIRATPRIKDMRGFGLPRLKLNPPKPCVLHCFTAFMHFITSIICHGLWYQMQSARYLHGFLAPLKTSWCLQPFVRHARKTYSWIAAFSAFNHIQFSKLRNKKHKTCILKETVCFFVPGPCLGKMADMFRRCLLPPHPTWNKYAIWVNFFSALWPREVLRLQSKFQRFFYLFLQRLCAV